jgi:hypothetical protein
MAAGDRIVLPSPGCETENQESANSLPERGAFLYELVGVRYVR